MKTIPKIFYIIVTLLALSLVLNGVSLGKNPSYTYHSNNSNYNISETKQIMEREIYLAGGCFWGVEHFLKFIPGVLETKVGYANSDIPTPTYREVCSGKTNAAEAVRVRYNADELALSFLLEKFFLVINPTTLNKQGNDIGTQYRTGIYYTDPTDKVIIDKSLTQLQEKYSKQIVVENEPLKNFYYAEDYHQLYLEENPTGYCHVAPEMFQLAKKSVCPQIYIKKDKEARLQVKLSNGKYKKKSTSELKSTLTPIQFHVTQKNGTEPAFKNEYWETTEKGIYVDVTTGEPLFSSTDKFISNCGWPAFAKPISETLLTEKRDTSYGMTRVEVRSKTGDSHLGHVFNDGPASMGGKRYCINSASLKFIPYNKMEEEGYSYLLFLFE